MNFQEEVQKPVPRKKIIVVASDQPCQPVAQYHQLSRLPQQYLCARQLKFKNLLLEYGLILIQQEINLINARIGQIENKDFNRPENQKKKKSRRPACEIQRNFQCEMCGKQYGTTISLNLHRRLKHINHLL